MGYKIKLTQGKYALVDKKDFNRISKHKWFLHKGKRDRVGYARRWVFQSKKTRKSKAIFMQYEILGIEQGGKVFIDHKNLNSLDNRRRNLRIANAYENAWNKKVSPLNKMSGVKGVSFVRDKNGNPRWCIARITVRGNRIYLGVFKTVNKARLAYLKAAKKYHKEFARV